MGSFAPETIALAAAVAALGGLVRGVTGFGGALVMTAPLALLLGPLVTVPVVLLLESFVAAPMLLSTLAQVRGRVIAPLAGAACAAVPLGGYILVNTDPQLLRRAIAAIVMVFSLLLLRGWRYAGPQRLGTSITLGAASGVMLGATSIGAPLVILYLLSGPDRIETTRANLSLYLVVICLAGLVMLGARGVLDATAAWTALWLAPGFTAGLLAGMRLFPYVSETRFRQLTLALLTVVSGGILLA